MKTKIIAWKVGNEFRAAPEGKLEKCVSGPTLAEAVGRLVLAKSRLLQVEVQMVVPKDEPVVDRSRDPKMVTPPMPPPVTNISELINELELR